MADAGFHSLLAPVFATRRREPMLILPDRTISYGEMDEAAGSMAGALVAAGVRPGDRIVVQVEKSAGNVTLYLAALRTGAVFVPLNTAYTEEELAYFLADAAPALFVGDPGRPVPTAVQSMTLGRDGAGTLADAAAAAVPAAAIGRAGGDLAAILYTSGTTGRSKGAMLSHDNLRSNAVALVDAWAMTAGDALLHALPIFHIHGLFVALHTAMLAGARILFHLSFDPGAVLADLPRASVLMGVPTFYTRLLADPSFTADLAAGVRAFISGSAPLTAETFAAFEARTGKRILERYGMSEAGIITSNPLDGPRIAGTVGYPLNGVRIRIAEAADAAKAAQAGEVEVAGPGVFSGYWRNAEKTAEAFTADGWFRTGDVGAVSPDGRLALVGRAKDLIIVGGFNVYPKEIEQILDAAPQIAESAVVGAPHPDMGEGVVAYIVAAEARQPTDEALAAIVAPLARFKRPRLFIPVEALPRNAMGKVQKQLLRERCKSAFQPA